MSKPVTALAIAITFTFAVAHGAPGGRDSVVLTSKDGRSELTLPNGWAGREGKNASSQVFAENATTHDYVQVISESRRDQTKSLKDYAAGRRDTLVKNLTGGTATEWESITLNDQPAVRCEIRGTLTKSGVKLGYVFTVIDSGTTYFQVPAWTTASQFEEHKIALCGLAAGLREKPASATKPASK